MTITKFITTVLFGLVAVFGVLYLIIMIQADQYINALAIVGTLFISWQVKQFMDKVLTF